MMITDKHEVAGKICADIKHICKSFGSRNAGGEGERQTAEYFYEELSACADEVKKEEFKVNPAAFTGWIPLSVSCFMLGIVSYFFSSLVALLLFVVGCIPFLFEYVMFKRMLDPLYPEMTSQNVTAIKRCSGEAKKRIYFVANTDACFENSLKYRFGGIMSVAIVVADIIGVIYFAALSVARWVLIGGVGAGIASGAMLYAGAAGLIFAPVLFSTYFTVSTKVIVNGANNNLTGCFIAARMLGALKDIQLENTEVGVILTGSGAVGLRGAKVWCEKHGNEIDRENTAFISLASLRELGSLNANSSEMTGLVKCDREVTSLILDSANALGLKCSNHRIPFEASDSAAFTQGGFKSSGFCAVNSRLPDYFYTRYDSYENLSRDCIAEGFALTMEIVKRYSGEDIDISCISEQEPAEMIRDSVPEQSAEADN